MVMLQELGVCVGHLTRAGSAQGYVRASTRVSLLREAPPSRTGITRPARHGTRHNLRDTCHHGGLSCNPQGCSVHQSVASLYCIFTAPNTYFHCISPISSTLLTTRGCSATVQHTICTSAGLYRFCFATVEISSLLNAAPLTVWAKSREDEALPPLSPSPP